MSLNCGRCKEKVNVIGNEDTLEYIKHEGVIFCNKFCFNNRFIPMNISKQRGKNKNATKIKPCTLHVVDNEVDYRVALDKIYGKDYPSGEKFIYREAYLHGPKVRKDMKGFKIKNTFIHFEETEEVKIKIENLKTDLNYLNNKRF